MSEELDYSTFIIIYTVLKKMTQTHKRPCPSSNNDKQPSSKRSYSTQSSTQSDNVVGGGISSTQSDIEMDTDDASNFELDLSMCPELSSVRDSLSQLDIDKDDIAKEEEVGDEQQMEAIEHARKGGNLFLTGKGM